MYVSFDMKMRLSMLVIALLALWFLSVTACGQQIPPGTDWTARKPGAPEGKVRAFTVDDSQYGRKRNIWVYTPADYDPLGSAKYGLILSFDGEDYIKDIPGPIILDNLIAEKRLDPVIQVFVDNSDDRLGDLANRQKFADFTAKELLPWIRKNYHIVDDAGKVVLCGYSAGGLGAAYVAYRYPTMFGNVLSQSGAFWRGNEGASSPSEWLTEQYQASKRLNIKFYLVVGGNETVRNSSGRSMVETSRRLRDVLTVKGYNVGYLEFPGGVHDPASWRQELADGLIFLFGRSVK